MSGLLKKNRRTMRHASKLIDAFRQRYGKVKNSFDSLETLRKIQDSRR
jgi:hypothetical protein